MLLFLYRICSKFLFRNNLKSLKLSSNIFLEAKKPTTEVLIEAPTYPASGNIP